MQPLKVDDFYAFKIKPMWMYFKSEHFSFWMICCYLAFEFIRPQSIFPSIDFLPWAQLFILLSFAGIFTDRNSKWVSSPANKWMVCFLLVIIISIYTAHYPDVSKKHFMDFFGWFLIYFLIINIVNTKERFYIFLLIFLVASAKIAVGTSKSWALRGFSFTSWGLMGPRGFFQNSGELAILMLLLFPLAYFLWISLKGKAGVWERRVLLLFWICPIMTILGASSRGSQIALAVQLIFIFRKSMFKIKPLIGIVALITALFFLLPEEQKQRFSQTGEDRTSQQRLLYWSNGWEMMKENPAFGVGFFNFIPYYQHYYPQDMLYKRAELPHNIFIQVGTDTGFIGLFFFAFIILYCLRISIPISRRTDIDPIWPAIAAGLGYGLLGFVIAGQFVTVAYYPFLWIHLSLLVCLSKILATPVKNGSLEGRQVIDGPAENNSNV